MALRETYLSFATSARSPQKHVSIAVDPYRPDM